MRKQKRYWKISQTDRGIGFFCPGLGTFWATIKAGRSARIHRFLANLFSVKPSHPRHDRFVKGWTAGLEPKFGDQQEKFGGIRYLTFWEKEDRPGVVVEFIRKLPPVELLEDIALWIGTEEEKPKPKPKRKRAPRKKKTSTKVEAKAAAVEAKTETPEGDNAPEAQEKNDG